MGVRKRRRRDEREGEEKAVMRKRSEGGTDSHMWCRMERRLGEQRERKMKRDHG